MVERNGSKFEKTHDADSARPFLRSSSRIQGIGARSCWYEVLDDVCSRVVGQILWRSRAKSKCKASPQCVTEGGLNPASCVRTSEVKQKMSMEGTYLAD